MFFSFWSGLGVRSERYVDNVHTAMRFREREGSGASAQTNTQRTPKITEEEMEFDEKGWWWWCQLSPTSSQMLTKSARGKKRGDLAGSALPDFFSFFFFCGCVPELKKNVSTTHIFLFLIDCFIWKVGIFCVQRWVVRSSPVHLFKFRNVFLFGHWYALHTVVWLSISLDLKGLKKNKIWMTWLSVNLLQHAFKMLTCPYRGMSLSPVFPVSIFGHTRRPWRQKKI